MNAGDFAVVDASIDPLVAMVHRHLLALVAFVALPVFACESRTTPAKQQEAAKAASASSADAAEDTAAADLAEQKYLERKKALEESVTNMKADEGHVMAHDAVATPGVLRHYFAPGADGDKAAKDLEAKRKKDGADGYRIKVARISDTRFVGDVTSAAFDAEVDVIEETVAKGSSACLLSTQKWTSKDERWWFVENARVVKVDCEK